MIESERKGRPWAVTRSRTILRRRVTRPVRPSGAPRPGTIAGSFGADLTDEDIAAIEASEMEPGFEHLNAEIDDV